MNVALVNTVRRVVFVPLIAAAIGIVPGAAHAAQAPATRPVHAATAAQAVQIVIRPYDTRGYNFANCTTRSPRRYPELVCPETARLRHYLQNRHLPAVDAGLPFCRCQSGPQSVKVMAVHRNNAGSASVTVRWDFGRTARAEHNYALDTFIVVHHAAGWLVDNEYCSGRPASSIYNGVAGESHCYKG